VCQVDKDKYKPQRSTTTHFLFKWHQRNSYEKEEDRWYLTKQMKDCVSKANEVDGSEGELETEEEISFRDFNLKDCNK
jgi:hypothetical protein